MRYALLLTYDGSGYGGWQIQNNAVTLQEKLTQAIRDTLNQEVSVVASGRTDAGVHAKGQVCHFDAETKIAPDKLSDAFNARLPLDISVLQTIAAPECFDARASAKRKTYCYRFYSLKRRMPLLDGYAVQVKCDMDFNKLQRAAKLFIGEHDFKAYCASGSQVKTTVRTIYDIEIKRTGCLIEIYVTGNGFLYNMVRTVAGTMLFYSAGKISEKDILRSLVDGDRSAVGKTMPAKGLTLEKVEYGYKIFNDIFTQPF